MDVDGYSLWGGSAGGRMAAWVGSYGAAAFGGDELPRPAAVSCSEPGGILFSLRTSLTRPENRLCFPGFFLQYVRAFKISDASKAPL